VALPITPHALLNARHWKTACGYGYAADCFCRVSAQPKGLFFLVAEAVAPITLPPR